MILIDEILVEQAIADGHFACDVAACKGACCWEGDYGAPLEAKEEDIISDLLPMVRPYLGSEAKNVIDKEGISTY